MKKLLLVLVLIMSFAGCKKAVEDPKGSVIEVLEDAGAHAILLATGDVYIENNDTLTKVPTSDVKQIAKWHGELWMVKNNGELVVKDGFGKEAPYVYAGLSKVEKVVMGRGNEKFAIMQDGKLFDLDSFAEIEVKNVVDVVEFGTGSFIALTKKGELWGWGKNISAHNILSQSGVAEVTKPVKIPIKKVQKLYSSKEIALALCKNGDLYVWGGHSALQQCADDIMGHVNKPKRIYRKVADVHMQTAYNNQDFSYAAILLKNGTVEVLAGYDQIPVDGLSDIAKIYGDGAAIYAVSKTDELIIRGHSRVMDASKLGGIKNITPPTNTKSSFYEGNVFFNTKDGWYMLDHAQLGAGFQRVLGLFEPPYISTDNTAWISDSEYIYRIDNGMVTPLSPLQP